MCLKPKYHVKDPRSPSKGTHIIDPAPFGANYDFRMVHQSKPGGERPLKPITHLDKPAEFFMLEHIPPGAKQLQSRIPAVNPPALPAQLLGDPEAAFISSEKSAAPSASGSVYSGRSDRTQQEIVSSKRLSFLTDAGKLWQPIKCWPELASKTYHLPTWKPAVVYTAAHTRGAGAAPAPRGRGTTATMSNCTSGGRAR